MSASDVCSQQGAIQTHVYRLRYGRQTDGRRHIPKHNVDTHNTLLLTQPAGRLRLLVRIPWLRHLTVWFLKFIVVS